MGEGGYRGKKILGGVILQVADIRNPYNPYVRYARVKCFLSTGGCEAGRARYPFLFIVEHERLGCVSLGGG